MTRLIIHIIVKSQEIYFLFTRTAAEREQSAGLLTVHDLITCHQLQHNHIVIIKSYNKCTVCWSVTV